MREIDGMCELYIVGENVADDVELERIIKETPPTMRFQRTALMQQGVNHLLRIRPELWPQ